MSDQGAHLTVDELERVLTAPERLIRHALEAEDRATAEIHAGSPVAAREWLDVAIRARELSKVWEPGVAQ